VEPSVLQDWVTSLIAVVAGLAGIGVAWVLYARRTRPVPRQPQVQHALEHKLYFDEAYDYAFYHPASWTATFLARWFERPLIGGSLTGIAAGTRLLGGRFGRIQTGFLRTYALAIAGGVAILALVFVSAR
jgi:NADH-quinone oxidoreductase subunit L